MRPHGAIILAWLSLAACRGTPAHVAVGPDCPATRGSTAPRLGGTPVAFEEVYREAFGGPAQRPGVSVVSSPAEYQQLVEKYGLPSRFDFPTHFLVVVEREISWSCQGDHVVQMTKRDQHYEVLVSCRSYYGERPFPPAQGYTVHIVAVAGAPLPLRVVRHHERVRLDDDID